MARMVPESPRTGRGGQVAEALLFAALRERLDDDHFVYHGLSYVDEKSAGEGEADFLVVHRTRGILNVECKGGGVRRRTDGSWWRDRDGRAPERMSETPYEQAQRTIKELASELARRCAHALPERRGLPFPFVHGHAVAFPRVDMGDSALAIDAPRRITVDRGDLARLADKVADIFAFWAAAASARRFEPLSPDDFKRFRKRVLQPALCLVPRLTDELTDEAEQLARLTAQQRFVADAAQVNRRMAVIGGAGTGKTVAALEVARRLARDGQRVLLLCYNRALAHTLARQFGVDEGLAGRVDACHFHGLCERAYEALGRRMTLPDDAVGRARVFDREAPEVLSEAVIEGLLGPWDAAVVDEAQDFAASWWEVIDDLVGGRDVGRLVLFHDPEQDIFARGGDALPKMPVVLPLRQNLRNTRAIAAAVARLGAQELEPAPFAPEGAPPRSIESRSARRDREALGELVRRLVEVEGVRADRITILSPHQRDRSCLAGVTELAGLPLADDPALRSGRLLHATIGAFKGLESDVVILADVDPHDPRCGRRERYVAASRACHRLFVYTKGDWLAV